MATLKTQLVEKQAVQSENNRLKLQLDSIQAQNLIEQRKAGEDRSEAACTHIHCDYYYSPCIHSHSGYMWIYTQSVRDNPLPPFLTGTPWPS